MQKYEGYESLILQCETLLDECEIDFVKKAKSLLKEQDFYADPDDFESVMSVAFRAIIGYGTSAKSVLDGLKACLNKDEKLAKYILKNSILDFKKNFKEKEPRFENTLEAAISRFNNDFGLNEDIVIKKAGQEEQIQTNTISFDGENTLIFGDIFSELKAAKESELWLLNLYKGVPIKNKAKITDIENEKLSLKTELIQLLAIKEEGSAFILKGENISSDIECKVLNFNFGAGVVMLEPFRRSTKTAALLRAHPRIQPSKLTPVSLLCDNGRIDAQLFDISRGGLGAICANGLRLQSGSKLKAIFNLEIAGALKQISLNLELVVALNYQGTMRYCCKIADTAQPCMSDIFAYTDIRQKETLDELSKKAQDFL
ncbi:PilZ domain-containing protein [Campylobacter sp.]|uniref:PilZ domain-containing protein n=1 Tax=Campylobacter sp. TaxID=205 RepID=UPI002AA866F5|nr:PilZ domain-containing protein [Campylobacter sp.]MCI6660870.1 PilZ domain-containing protein [Campylobacter sp.]